MTLSADKRGLNCLPLFSNVGRSQIEGCACHMALFIPMPLPFWDLILILIDTKPCVIFLLNSFLRNLIVVGSSWHCSRRSTKSGSNPDLWSSVQRQLTIQKFMLRLNHFCCQLASTAGHEVCNRRKGHGESSSHLSGLSAGEAFLH